MLTIKNIEKLTQYGAVGDWRVGKVVTLDSSYLIQLYKHNRRETMQVNIERTPIGEGDTALYELWFWEDDSGSANPIRRLLGKSSFELGPSYVIKNIENMMNLK
jgi:hypothetical protein